MPTTPASAYAEAQIACAPPLKLVRLVNGGAVASLRGALARLDAGDAAGFVRAASKAQSLVGELHANLDMERGAEVARQLDRLYSWATRALVEATTRRDRRGIESVVQVLGTLQEGWDGIRDEAVSHGR
ncbi:MAG TPA: flagellar export chaperone FliS [Planctomycetota bacterium]|nr:flagellar export chaperone FliS [Planctomycetota bacterium]